MLRYVLRRLAWAIPTLIFVTFLVYIALRIGTDPVASYKRINPRATKAKIAQYIEVNGLDPNYVRGYFRWLGNFVTLDWPRSIKGSREVWPQLKDALANTIRLGVAASSVGIVIGLGLGVFAALRPGGRRDVAVNTAAFVGISIPPYVSAILFQLLFAVYWSRWFGSTLFPTSGVYPPGQLGFDLGLMLKHMVLPTFVVAIQIIAVYSRYMRSSLLDVLNSEYMRTARSKGISEARVLFRHGLRNALIPVVTIAALDVGAIVGGLIITENVFSYPG
ncbi:MAG: ABC transporter permease, partial [Actinomycetota bacterium]